MESRTMRQLAEQRACRLAAQMAAGLPRPLAGVDEPPEKFQWPRKKAQAETRT
jgi:class 3 adenylate cyclase